MKRSAMRERRYYFLKHGLNSLAALPNYMWRTGEKIEPKVFRRVRVGDRWIAFAYTTSDRRERPLSQITGFFECVRESRYDRIPPEGRLISGRAKWAWLIEGKAHGTQPSEPVDVPSIDVLLGKKTFKGQTLVPITESQFKDVQRRVAASAEGTKIITKEINQPEIEAFWEGIQRRVMTNSYERNPRARASCLDHYGYACAVCGFDFATSFGQSMKRVIHVHHLRPISKGKGRRKVDPIADMRPVCPNCHAVIHSRREPLTIDEVRELRNG